MSTRFDTTTLSKDELIQLLSAKGEEEQSLFNRAAEIKQLHIGNTVYLRGLIELSNACEKDCYYCGIRRSNTLTHRYAVTHDEVIQAAKMAYEKGMGSIAIQSGEVASKAFTYKIDQILKAVYALSDGKLGVTLSCGEQSEETYRRWFESGAHRYLLRIESSSEELYNRIHPQDDTHRFSKRLNALETLKKVGYQTGTGVMIGLPFQTLKHLADDLLFMKQFDIDMCGMGPYIEHAETPLYRYKKELPPLAKRLELSFKMVALLRILMPDINIAATTALQAIKKNGREKAIQIGANILMPNITPKQYRDDYFLYQNKPVSANSDEDELTFLEQRLEAIGHKIGYFERGDSRHYLQKSREH